MVRAGSWPSSEVLLEPLGGVVHQLGGGGQVPVALCWADMPEIDRQHGDPLVDLNTTALPVDQGADSEAVSELVRGRVDRVGPQAKRGRQRAQRLRDSAAIQAGADTGEEE